MGLKVRNWVSKIGVFTSTDRTQAGGINEAYILRTVGSSEFNYNAGKERLVNLEPDLFGDQSTVFTSVAEDPMDVNVEGGGQSKQSNVMRLGTHINLDSTLSVSGLRVSFFEKYYSCHQLR